jgi:hypothetical protein
MGKTTRGAGGGDRIKTHFRFMARGPFYGGGRGGGQYPKYKVSILTGLKKCSGGWRVAEGEGIALIFLLIYQALEPLKKKLLYICHDDGRKMS